MATLTNDPQRSCVISDLKDSSCSIPFVAAVALSAGAYLFELTEQSASALYLLAKAGKEGCGPGNCPDVNWKKQVSELRELGIPIRGIGHQSDIGSTSSKVRFRLLTSTQLLVGKSQDLR